MVTIVVVDGRQLVMLITASSVVLPSSSLTCSFFFYASWWLTGVVHLLRKATVLPDSAYRRLSLAIPREMLKRAGVNDLEAIIRDSRGGSDAGGAASSSSDVGEATGSRTQPPPALTAGRMLFGGVVAAEPHAAAEAPPPEDDAEEDNHSVTVAGEGGGEPVHGSASTLAETSPSGLSPDALKRFPELEHVLLPRYERVTDASGKKVVPVAENLVDPALDVNTPSVTTPVVHDPAPVPNTPREAPHDDQRFWVSPQAGEDGFWYSTANLHVCPCGKAGSEVEHSSGNYTGLIASWLRGLYALPNDSPLKSRLIWFKKHFKWGVFEEEYQKFVPRVNHIALGLLQDAYPIKAVAEGEKSSAASQLGGHIINLADLVNHPDFIQAFAKWDASDSSPIARVFGAEMDKLVSTLEKHGLWVTMSDDVPADIVAPGTGRYYMSGGPGMPYQHYEPPLFVRGAKIHFTFQFIGKPDLAMLHGWLGSESCSSAYNSCFFAVHSKEQRDRDAVLRRVTPSSFIDQDERFRDFVGQVSHLENVVKPDAAASINVLVASSPDPENDQKLAGDVSKVVNGMHNAMLKFARHRRTDKATGCRVPGTGVAYMTSVPRRFAGKCGTDPMHHGCNDAKRLVADLVEAAAQASLGLKHPFFYRQRGSTGSGVKVPDLERLPPWDPLKKIESVLRSVSPKLGREVLRLYRPLEVRLKHTC